MTRRSIGATSLAFGLGLLATSCLPLPWGAGGLADELPVGTIDPRGMLVALGPTELTASASRLANLLPPAWREGAPISGQLALDGGLAVAWDGLLVVPGPVTLRFEQATLVAELGVSFLGDEVTLAAEVWGERCDARLMLETAQLALRVGLTSDKLGRVQASWSGGATLDGFDGAMDWSGCDVAGLVLETLEGVFRDALRDAAADVLAPDLLLELPRALGLDLATGLATAIAADELGAGFARVSVRAYAPPNGGPVIPTSDGVLVAFEVGISVDPHPCMPPVALPPVSASQLPAEDVLAGGIAISASVVDRAIGALWLGGALCGDHGTSGVTLPAGDLAHAWPMLGDLPPETRIGLQVWPRGLPRVGLAVDGADRVTVSTGLTDVDLYADLDGASVRLATVTVDLDVVVGLDASATGAVTLDALDARVRGVGVRRGLFEAPSSALAEQLLVPLVDALVDGRPWVRLPARPMGSVGRRARVTSQHVIFGADEPRQDSFRGPRG